MLESCIIMKAQSCPLSGENPLIDLQIYFSMRFIMMMAKSELEKNQTWQMPYTAHTNVDCLTPRSD